MLFWGRSEFDRRLDSIRLRDRGLKLTSVLHLGGAGRGLAQPHFTSVIVLLIQRSSCRRSERFGLQKLNNLGSRGGVSDPAERAA